MRIPCRRRERWESAKSKSASVALEEMKILLESALLIPPTFMTLYSICIISRLQTTRAPGDQLATGARWSVAWQVRETTAISFFLFALRWPLPLFLGIPSFFTTFFRSLLYLYPIYITWKRGSYTFQTCFRNFFFLELFLKKNRTHSSNWMFFLLIKLYAVYGEILSWVKNAVLSSRVIR